MFQHNFNAYHVVLVQKEQPNSFGSINKPRNSSSINLFNQSFDFLPRLFTIKTNNGNYKFNTELLKDSSKTISSQLEADPTILEYYLDIIDDNKTMKKFEDIFLGQVVTFEFDELLSVRQIVQLLRIEQCPIYFKADLNITYYSIPSKIEIEIQRNSILSFFYSKFKRTFTIKTNKKEYKCSEYGVLSSKIIREKLKENPDMTEYQFNYEDENEEFQLICNVFNFENIFLTVNNMDSLKIISDELQIEPIIDSIDKYINSYENSVQLIDDKKTIIDTIEEIFNLLHNIQLLTVESVKKSILNSIWVKTEENIQELVACIFQTVRVGYKLQPYLIDLVISLHEESDNQTDDKNCLKKFLPYLKNQLKFSFSKSPFYTSFYFKLAKKGVFEMKEAIDEAFRIVMDKTNEYKNKDVINVLLWFLPELFEENKNNDDFLNLKIDQKSASFFKKFFPSNVESYRLMRDSGMPIDDISRSIYNDDVDTLQSIVSKRGIDINEMKIEPTLFDVFEFNSNISFLNYSVMHGSVKCYKYLLLNHAEMDNLTFVLSIYGGNTEIIRSVDQKDPPLPDSLKDNHLAIAGMNNNMASRFSFFNIESNFYYKYDFNYLQNIFSPAIMNHQNDLFDWLFETKFDKLGSLLDLAFIAVQNGNANALIHCIDKGLEMNQNINNFVVVLLTQACHDGFYRILQLIVSLSKNELNNIQIPIDQSFYSGNYLIHDLMKDKIKSHNMNNYNIYPILGSIEKGHNKLIMDAIEKGEIVLLNGSSFKTFFTAISKNKNIELFHFLKEKYTFDRIDNLYSMYNDIFNLFSVLNECCSSGFFEAVKEITEFILSKNSKSDFTYSFYRAVCANQKEVYDYLLDKDVEISIKPNDSMLYGITKLDNETCIKLFDKIKPDIKNDVLNEIFNLAVLNGNENLVKLLLDPNRLNYLSLINAVQSSNLEIVNLILSINSDPSFVNIVQKDGSALNISVQKNNIEITKRLLSIPGIDTNLYGHNDCTPLMSAIVNFNIEMIDLIVDFYGDIIQSQIWQINNGIKMILSFLSTSEEQPIKPKKYNDDDEYNEDDDDENNEGNLRKISLIDSKSKIINNKEKIFKTISKLSQFENVDLNCHFSSYTLLSYACEVNELDLFKLLLKSNKVNINSYAPSTGNSPLMIAIENSNIEISQLLIEYSQTDINHRNYNGQTALTIAVSKGNYIIVKILVNDEKFDHKMSGLSDAYFKSSNKITEILFNVKEFDVNSNIKIKDYINLFIDNNNINSINNNNFKNISLQNLNFSLMLKISFITPLIKAIFDRNEEMIDLIVGHQSFNKEKSRFVDAIFTSVYMNDVNIFRKLLNLFGNDVNLIDQEGKSLLYFSIYMTSNSITTEILNNNSFDPLKSQLVSSFLKAGLFITSSIRNGENCNNSYNNNNGPNFNNSMFSQFGIPAFGIPNNSNTQIQNNAFGGPLMNNQNNALIAQMNEICDFDEENGNLIKFNDFLPSGKTFLTSMNPSLLNINDALNLLIERGADPNLQDKNGVYPIEYAIQLFGVNFISSLTHLQNINLNIISSGNCINSIKGDTVLHMIIRCQINILNQFNDILNMDNLNVLNVENVEGDTAFLVACKLKKMNYITSLFSRNDIDYKHRNKEGKDALDILQSVTDQFSHKKFMNYGWGGNQVQNLNLRDIHPDEKRDYYQKIMKFFYA